VKDGLEVGRWAVMVNGGWLCAGDGLSSLLFFFCPNL